MGLSGLPRLAFLPPALRLPCAVAIALFQGYLIAVAILFCFQRSFIYPTYGVPEETAPPIGVTRVEIPTSDGERLLGYWVPPRPGRPTVLSFHGNAGSPLYHAMRFSSAPWSTAGWGVLAVAYRGYPGSTGSPSEAGLTEDAEAAMRFVRSNVGDAPLVVHGHSLGAAVAVGVAARHRVDGLYLEAPFLDLRSAAAARFPWLPTSLIFDRYPSADRAPGITVPVHVVHGEEDPVVPFAHGKALAALFPHATFYPAPFQDHASVFGTRDYAVEEALRAQIAAARPAARRTPPADVEPATPAGTRTEASALPR